MTQLVIPGRGLVVGKSGQFVVPGRAQVTAAPTLATGTLSITLDGSTLSSTASVPLLGINVTLTATLADATVSATASVTAAEVANAVRTIPARAVIVDKPGQFMVPGRGFISAAPLAAGATVSSTLAVLP